MVLTKEKKKQIIEDLKSLLDKQKAVIFADFQGLKTDELLDLKKKLKAGRGVFKVAKKTLLQMAFKEKGFDEFGDIVRKLQGQVAAIFGLQDEIGPSKIASEFARGRTNFKILGGIFDRIFKDQNAVEELAALPSRQELEYRFVNVLTNPLSGLVRVLQENISKLITIFSKINKD